MIPLEEARERVLRDCDALTPRRVPVAEALGCVLAEEVTAAEAVPPFDNTAMDGFAVRAADTSSAPVALKVVDTLSAGKAPSRSVGEGEAIRIMTGAPMPPGADAIVMVERTQSSDGSVVIEQAASVGDHIRRAGDDVKPDQVVFSAGAELAAAHLGVLATLGFADVLVHPRARVGVMSTGDELVEGPAPLEPGQIRDANRRTLLALLAGSGCEPVDLGMVRDSETEIADAVSRAVASCDALVTSGGVSMGEFDYVKSVLDRLGEMEWMQVAIKPAKPLAFGVVEGKPVFGLPGNTVSSMVSFELFARPALRRMMGHSVLDRPTVLAQASEPLQRHADGKVHFARVVATYEEGEYRVRSAGGQGSHQLAAMAAANALAVLPDGSGVDEGEFVSVMLLA